MTSAQNNMTYTTTSQFPMQVAIVAAASIATISSGVYVSHKETNIRNKALDWLHNLEPLITKSVLQYVSSAYTWETLLQTVSTILSSSGTLTAIPVLLFSSVEDLKYTQKAQLDQLLRDHLTSLQAGVPTVVQKAIDVTEKNHSSVFTNLIKGLNSGEKAQLQSQYKTLRSSLIANIKSVAELRARESITERSAAILDLFGTAQQGALAQYSSFILAAQSITREFDAENQVIQWIKNEVQKSIQSTVVSFVSMANLKRYVDNSNLLLEELKTAFLDATDFKLKMRNLVEFRIDAGQMVNVIREEIGVTFSTRLELIEKDNSLTKSQKIALGAFADKLRMNTLSAVVSLSPISKGDALQELNSYMKLFLDQVRVCVLAVALSYENSRRRAKLEGSQSVVLRFFELRQSLTVSFFVAFAQLHGFDIARMETELWKLYDTKVKKESIPSLCRLNKISYVYESGRRFATSLINTFLVDDSIALSYLNTAVTTLHSDWSLYMGEELLNGIANVYPEEEALTEAFVREALEVQKKEAAVVICLKHISLLKDLTLFQLGDLYTKSMAVASAIANSYKDKTLQIVVGKQALDQSVATHKSNGILDENAVRDEVMQRLGQVSNEVLQESEQELELKMRELTSFTENFLKSVNSIFESSGSTLEFLPPEKKDSISQMRDSSLKSMDALVVSFLTDMHLRNQRIFRRAVETVTSEAIVRIATYFA